MLARTMLAALIASAVVLGGCASTSAEQPTAEPATDNMGMGDPTGGMGMSDGGMIEGVVSSADKAIIEMGSGSRVSSEGVLVSRVVLPTDGWVVVNSTQEAHQPLGMTRVPQGESRDVLVRLKAADGPRAVVSLHVDRGVKDTFEWDSSMPLRSPDAMIYVDRKPVLEPITLSSFGVDVVANSALLMVEDQPAGRRALEVAYLLIPGPSWIAVHAITNGLPGKLLGQTKREGGEYQRILIPLDAKSTPGKVDVTVYQDGGTPGRFEFDVTDPLGSLDQPYRSAGEIVFRRIELTDK